MASSNDPGDSTDWSSVIFDPAFMAGLERMAAKRFVQPGLKDEAVTAMIEALSEDDWQCFQSFTGKSQPSTFAYSIASRAMEDFARRRFGRPRPPAWLQELGHAWVKLWHMLCLERQWPETIKTRLAKDFQEGLIEQVIRTIKQKIPRCGEPGFAECCTTELGLEQLPDDQGASLNASLRHAQRARAMALLSQLLGQSETSEQMCPSNTEEALDDIDTLLSLSADDRLLLSLSYEDGLSSRKIAELLDISAATVQRRLQGIRAELQDCLQQLGIDGVTDLESEFGQ
ncbi:sigma-70 family RNA polymerase sigma factor [Marinobacter salinexigens]|uniref:Sigma-70 family RNA polymerase sigma factor n=1 Tax=Marinobacter salinexigens TaxID=2919747 RepID=A0A5B0VFJ8_9GAMM|nr:sigma-70 family RNA polymerase sigma factor [Marinobacter salinexigens]KAA1172811.1 sigma-70 family RNA polymerase sigma factor [Marinobacter salinexigens]